MKNNFIKYIFSPIRYKIDEKKMIIILITFLIIFILNDIIVMKLNPGSKYSFFDLFLWHMSKDINLVFIHTLFFIIIIDKVISFSGVDVIYTVKQKSRKGVLVAKLLSVLLLSILYIMISVIITLLQSIGKSCFNSNWSQLSIMNFGILYTNGIDKLSNLMYPFMINLVLYFITIGFIYLFFLLLIKNKIIATFITITIGILGYIVYLCKVEQFYKFTLLGNVILGFGQNQLNIKPNFVYWGINIIILSLLCYKIYKRTDLTWKG